MESMARALEPELMEDLEQARAYSEADFAAPHDRCVELFLAGWPAAAGPIQGRALDLGCGPADITVRLAKACPGLQIDGLDGSPSMLHYGRARVEAAGLTERIQLNQAFLPDDPPPRAPYDLVVSSSLLHHLHHPEVFWTYLARYGRPGAQVFVFDLMRPRDRVEAEAMVQTYSGGEPEVLQRDFYNSLCAAFRPGEIQAQLAQAGLKALRVEPVSDRHLVVRGTLSGPSLPAATSGS